MGTAVKAKRVKKPRTARRASKASLVLTERDLDLLTLTGLCRYVSTNQLGREFFPSFDRTRRRLRALFDADYISIALASSTLPNLISLTRKGLAAISETQPDLSSRLGLAGTIRLQGVRHHLSVVDMRLYAAAIGALREAPLVRWSNGGSERLKELGLDAHRLVPDGVAEFRAPAGPVAVAIEVDLGTEALPVLARKWTKYRRAAGDGALDALWVYVDAGAGRRATIGEQLSAHCLAGWARVFGNEVVRRPVVEFARRAEGPNTERSVSEEARSDHELASKKGDVDRRPDGRADGRG